MIQSFFVRRAAVLIGALIIWTAQLQAAACNATSDGNWSGAIWTGCTGPGGIPAPTDTITINSAINVTLDVDATVAGLTFASPGTTNNLTHSGTTVLTVNGPVTFNQPTTNSRNNTWLINAGSATVTGVITFAGSNTTTSRLSQITITSGELNALGGMTFQGNTAATKRIVMSGGAGRLSLSGALTFSGNSATLTAGSAGSRFNYADTAAPQTVRNFASGAYHILEINNTGGGATLGYVQTSTNVTLSVRVQSGVLSNGGYAMTGAAADSFLISADAAFEMTGTSAFPTGFGTITIDPASTVRFRQTTNPLTIPLRDYGNLELLSAGTATQRFPAGTMTINGDLVIGNGTNATTADAATNNANLTVLGSVSINKSATFTAHNANPLEVGGDWTSIGTFTAGSSTVAFISSAAQTVYSGAQNFTHVIASNTSAGGLTFARGFTAQRLTVTTAGLNGGSTVYFAGGNTFTISTFNVQGVGGAPVVLRSTEPGTAWNLNNTRSHAVAYVDVQDSDASGGLRIVNHPGAVDGGNNVNWANGVNPPENLSAPSISAAAINGTWSPAVPAPDTYTLETSTSADFIGVNSSSSTVFTSGSVDGLSPNSTYYLRVNSVIGGISGDWSATVTTATLANQPGIDTATAWEVFMSSLTISWLSNSNPAGTRYLAQISTVSGFSGGTTLSSTTLNLQANYTGLQSGVTYYGRVRAINHREVSSSNASLGSTVTIVVPVPFNFSFSTATTTSLSAAWSSAFSATAHTLQLSTSSDFIGTLFSSQTVLTAATVGGLAVNTTYFGRVNALLTQSSSAWTSAVATVTLTNSPTAAGSPWSNVFYTSFTVTWAANGNPAVTRYSAQTSTAANFTGQILSSATTGTTATLTQLESGGTYYVRVRAVNHAGINSNYLTVGSTKTSASAIPSNLQFSTGTSQSLTFTWGTGSTPGDTYTLQVGTAALFTGAILSSSTALLNGTVSGLSPNTTYYARVRAVVGGTPSAWSGSEIISTLANLPAAAGAPWPGVHITSVTLAWSANSNPAPSTKYTAVLSTVANFASGVSFSSITTGTTASFTDLTPSVTYHARVRALNNAQVSTLFFSIGSTLTLAAVAPSTPEMLLVGVSSIAAQWGAAIPAGLTYTLSVATAANFTGTVVSSTTVLTDAVVNGLSFNTTHYVRVRADYSGSASPWSAATATATLAAAPATAVSTWTMVSLSSATMNWTSGGNPSNRTMYVAEMSDSADFSTNLVSSTTANLQATLEDLMTNTVYYGRVAAVNVDNTLSNYAATGSTQTLSPTLCNATSDGNWTAAIWTGCTGPGGVPAATDAVTINSGVNVTLNTNATVAGLTFAAPGTNNDLTHSGSNELIVNGNVTFNQPTTSSRNNQWLINAGAATVNGLINFAGTNTTTSRVSRITITTGQLDALGGISFVGNAAATKQIVMSGGAGRLNLKGNLTFSGNSATLTAGSAGSVFNYADNAAPQTIRNFASGAYHILEINNTGGGATLGFVQTSTNVTLSVRVQSGVLKNGGYAMTGAAGDSLIVNDGAAFEMSGTAAFPSGYSTITLNPDSTIRYRQTSNPLTITLRDYGNLELLPAGTATQRFPAGTITINGDLMIGNGTNSTTADAATHSANLTVLGSMTINKSAIFTAHNTNPLEVDGDWINLGAFNAGASTVSLLGSGAQTVYSGGSPFAHLIASNTSAAGITFSHGFTAQRFTALTQGATITFAGGNTFTISTFNAAGVPGAVAVFRSTEPGTAWNINNTVSHGLAYVDAQDADASGGLRLLAYPGGVDSGNNSNWVFTINAPGNFRFAGTTKNGLSTAWNNASPSGDAYEIDVSTSADFGGTILNSQTSNLIDTTPSTLATNTTYYARARTLISQVPSDWTAVIATATLADVPGLAAESWVGVWHSSITAAWEANSNPGGTLYAVNFSTVGDFSSGLTFSSTTVSLSATLAGLTPGETYHARVQAINRRNIGSAYLTLGSTQTLSLAAPSALAFSTGTSSTLTAGWNHAGPADGFVFELATTGSFDAIIGSSATALASATIGGLDPDKLYYGRSAALIGTSTGAWSSAESTATLANIPAQGATWFYVGFTSAVITWSANGNPVGNTLYSAQLSTVAAFTGGEIFTEETYDTSQWFSGLNSGATYYARVRSENMFGISTLYAALGSTRTQASALPVQLRASTATATSLTAAWNVGAQAGDSYSLQVSSDSDFLTGVVSSSTVQLSATVAGLAANNTYYFRVNGISGGSPSPWSSVESTATLANAPAAVGAPWSAVQITSFTVAFGANGNPAPTLFEIQTATSSNFSGGVVASSVTMSLSAAFAGLAPQATYYARARAFNQQEIASNFALLGSTLTQTAAAPVATVFAEVAASSVNVSWSAPEPVGDYYTLQVATQAAFTGTVISSVTVQPAAVADGLTANTTVYARVRALVQNSSSAWSAVITTSTWANVPAAAGSTWSLVGYSSFTMAWASGGNPSGRTLYIAEISDLSDFSDNIVSSATYGLSAGFADLLTGTVYYGRVKAINNNYVPSDYRALGSTQTTSPTLCNATSDGNWSTAGIWSGCTGPGGLPAPTNAVNINSAVNVTLDVDATVAGLSFSNPGTNNDLTHSGGAVLTVNGNVTFSQPTTSSRFNSWFINAGSATVTGLISFNGANTTTSRVSRIVITTGELNALGGMTFAGNTAATKLITMSGGAGRLNLGGALTFSGNSATLAAGTSGAVFNYMGASAQTIRTLSTWIYHQLHINNTSASGATLAAAVSATNVTGSLRVQSGTFSNGGFAVVGGAGDTFEIAAGGTFEMQGFTTFPTGFTTTTINAASTIRYRQLSNTLTIDALAFGNLELKPATTATHNFPSGAMTIQGNLVIGDGVNAASADASANNTALSVNGTVSIAAGGALTAHAANTLTVDGNWQNAGSFNANGGTVSFSGSEVALAGNTTFYVLRVLTAGATLQFDAGSETSVTHKIELLDAALHSSSDGNLWTFNITAASQTLRNLIVRDSMGAVFTQAERSVDGGNNLNWDFGLPSPVINPAAETSLVGSAISLTWQASGDDGLNGDLNNAEFIVQYTSNAAFAQSSAWSPTAGLTDGVYRTVIATTGVQPLTESLLNVEGLSGGDTYYFRLWARDDAGNYSFLSAGATNYAAPDVISLLMSTDTLSAGFLNPGSVVVLTTPIVVKNDGNVPMTTVFRATTTAEEWPWQIGVTQDIDQFVLWMVVNETQPLPTAFGEEDMLNHADVPCSDATFASGGNCLSIPPGEERTLWFKIGVPPLLHTNKDQIIRVIGTASDGG